MAGEAVLLADVLLEPSETPREGDLLGRRELLIAKDDDLVLEKCARNPGERVIFERPRKIGTADFRAEVPAEFPD
jgi:hypothetical protein